MLQFNLRDQAAISRRVSFSGIGVHSGLDVNIVVCPAPVNSGYIFVRTDVLDKNNQIELNYQNVVDPIMCTKVVNSDGVSVSVIEHLLAAMRIVGITNAIIEIDGPEVPIMDGSAICFVKQMNKAGVVEQNEKVPAIVIDKEISVTWDNGYISISPSDKCSIDIKLDYERINGVIGSCNNAVVTMDDVKKLQKIAEARTFGWLDDCEKIRSLGMAKGSSLENTVIIASDNSILNDDGVRCEHEIVHHKMLDLIGDFAVANYDIVGKISGLNTSHAQNNIILQKLMSELDKHTVVNNDICEDVFPSPSYPRVESYSY